MKNATGSQKTASASGNIWGELKDSSTRGHAEARPRPVRRDMTDLTRAYKEEFL